MKGHASHTQNESKAQKPEKPFCTPSTQHHMAVAEREKERIALLSKKGQFFIYIF
jgi:hypothetical protein